MKKRSVGRDHYLFRLHPPLLIPDAQYATMRCGESVGGGDLRVFLESFSSVYKLAIRLKLF